MPPDIPPEVYAWLMANMQSLPEWSKSSGYEPMDLSSQSKGLNFQQDFQNFLFDPQFAMQAGPTAYDPYSMQMAMQEYQPAMTAGEDKLVNVIQRSPASPEALVAMALLGVDKNLQPVAPPMDARSAVQQAKAAWEAAGNKDWPEPDSKGNDSMASFAQSSWDALMSDTPQQGTNDPFTKAGFTSPDARFDEQLFDPSGRVAGMEAKTKAAQSKAEAASRAEQDFFTARAVRGKMDEGLDLFGGRSTKTGSLADAATSGGAQRRAVDLAEPLYGSGVGQAISGTGGSLSVGPQGKPMSIIEAVMRARVGDAGTAAAGDSRGFDIAQAMTGGMPYKGLDAAQAIAGSAPTQDKPLDAVGAASLPSRIVDGAVGMGADGFTRPNNMIAPFWASPLTNVVHALNPFNGGRLVANANIEASAAKTRAAALENASGLERAKLDAKIRSTTDVHGSPFLMQLAQRQQQARQLGLIP